MKSILLQITLFTTVGLFGLNSISAQIYWPFEYQDKNLYERVDIKEWIAELKQGLKPMDMSGLSQLNAGDVDLYLFDEVARIHVRALQSDPDSRFDRSITQCPQHRAFDLSAHLSWVSSQPRCQVVKDEMIEALGDIHWGCEAVYAPDSIALNSSSLDVNFLTMTRLENLLHVAVQALAQVNDMRGDIFSSQDIAKLRRIYAKIISDKILQHLRAKTRAYGNFLKRVKFEKCHSLQDEQNLADELTRLQVESEQAQKDLEQWVQKGLQQAQKDQQQVVRSGRQRAQLPYPSLTDAEREMLSLYLGGVYWRLRGGGLYAFPAKTIMKRLLYNFLPMQIIGYLNGGEDGRQAGNMVFLRIFEGWARFQDMGTWRGDPEEGDDGDKYIDLVGMTNRGKYQVDSAVSLLRDRGYRTERLMTGGLQMGSCYYYVWHHLRHLRFGEDISAPGKPFVDDPSSLGELCSGAVIALGLSKTLLGGYDSNERRPPRDP